jgi:invasion protein IalB
MRPLTGLPVVLFLVGLPTAAMTQMATNSADRTSNTLGVVKVFEDWQISCLTGAPPSQCQMLHTAAAQQDENLAFLLTVSARAEDQAHYGVITVPVGVYLANGIEIFVDGRRPFKVLFEICDQRGCYAGFRLDGEVLAAFRAGQSARFRVWTGRSEAVEFPVSLKGFTAGWTTFQEMVAG